MAKRLWLFLVVVALMPGPATAQDGRNVLQAAAQTLGVTNMISIQYSGTGWLGAVGQNFAPDQDWPRFELASYTRTIDFVTNSSKEEMVVRPWFRRSRYQQEDYPAQGGGTPIQGEQARTALVSGAHAWNLQGSLYPREEWSEGYIFETVREKYILGDETRIVELHNVQGLNHVAGMLIAYFPKEKEDGGGGGPVHTAGPWRPSPRRPQCQQPDLLSESAAIEAGRRDHRTHSWTPGFDG